MLFPRPFHLVAVFVFQQVRVKIDASCAGKACDMASGRGAQVSNDDEWCEVLFAQQVPQGAYIDVDEVKVRKGHFNLTACRLSPFDFDSVRCRGLGSPVCCFPACMHVCVAATSCRSFVRISRAARSGVALIATLTNPWHRSRIPAVIKWVRHLLR